MKTIMAAIFYLVLCFWFSGAEAVEEYELDNEINRTLREIEKARAEHRRTVEATNADSREFREYRRRSDQRKKSLSVRTDSLSLQIQELSMVNDSLEAVYASLESKEKEYQYIQNRLQGGIIALCDSLMPVLSKLPPSAAGSSLDAVRFLRGEMIKKGIDNIEAMQRLFTLINEVEDEMMNITMLHGPSPVPQISGMVNRIRIGGVFEAAVARKGDRVALWDNESGRWFLIEDAQLTAQIREAIAIREGKQIPSLVELPLSRTFSSTDTTVADTDTTGGAR
ncbi:MAG: DUF3450 family protein [Chitinivibrionales bacterium]